MVARLPYGPSVVVVGTAIVARGGGGSLCHFAHGVKFNFGRGEPPIFCLLFSAFWGRLLLYLIRSTGAARGKWTLAFPSQMGGWSTGRFQSKRGVVHLGYGNVGIGLAEDFGSPPYLIEIPRRGRMVLNRYNNIRRTRGQYPATPPGNIVGSPSRAGCGSAALSSVFLGGVEIGSTASREVALYSGWLP